MVRVIAHRGASTTHRENTVEAFAAAATDGATGIEFDVRRTGDDVLIVHHDAHLPDGRLIAETDGSDLPDWIPTLAEVLDSDLGLWMNIEMKNLPGEPDYDDGNRMSTAVAGLIAAHVEPPSNGRSSTVLVSSFDVDSLLRLQAIDPTVPVGMLVWGLADPASTVARAAHHRFDAIHPHDLMVDRAFVQRCRRAELAVNVWTVDDPVRIVELAELGVDGIITNNPGAAKAALTGAGLLP